MDNTYYISNDFRNYRDLYLEHHGILGMKWGVRRYQNEDGSYTAAGRKRYGMNLDVNDKSRKNVAKIRLGEARRRYDVAKNNSKTKGRNDYRVAETRSRVKAAKSAVRRAGKIDRGAKLDAQGRTIIGNKQRQFITTGAAVMSSRAFTSFLNSRMQDLNSQGRLTTGHVEVMKALNNVGQISAYAIAGASAAHYGRQNSDLRAYRSSKYSGESTIRSFGSSEYKDVVERSKKNK